jgi:hypothetical protein
MKKTIIANVLVLLSTWIAPLPVFFILSDKSESEIVTPYQKFHADLPTGSGFLVHHLNSCNLAVLTLLVSVGLLVGQWRIRSEQTRFIFQVSSIVLWQLVTLGILYGRALPYFKMVEIHL